MENRLYSTIEYYERLWAESNIDSLHASIVQLGYNDAGLICAQLRARAQTNLAQYIETIRFK